MAAVALLVILLIIGWGCFRILKYRQATAPSELSKSKDDLLADGVWYMQGNSPSTDTGTEYAARFKSGTLKLSMDGILTLVGGGKVVFKNASRGIKALSTSATIGFIFSIKGDQFTITFDNPSPYARGVESGLAIKYRRWKKALRKAGVKIKWFSPSLDIK